MLIYVPQQDTGQHYGGRWARLSAVRRSRLLSQSSINLGIFVLSKKPPCNRVGETRNNKRNLKLPRIKQSNAFMFSAASLWNRLPEELKDCSTLTSFESKLKRTEIGKLQWTIFRNSLVYLSSNSRLWIIIFLIDYEEILSATLNYYYYYYYYSWSITIS